MLMCCYDYCLVFDVQGDVYGGHYYAYIRPAVGDFWSSIEEVDRDVTSAVASVPDGGASTDDIEKGTAAGASGRGESELGGKWYKFDDDQVSLVDRRTAVEGSFGSGAGSMLTRSYASAYMLVYIREAEAAHIMAPATIPPALTTRLNAEYQRHMEVQLTVSMTVCLPSVCLFVIF